MNSFLKEALIKQNTRREIKRKLSKHSAESRVFEATLYKAFVEPFTDVLQAANLASQDILNSSTTFLRMFFTFDPEKAQEILRKHDERRAKIEEKWKPLMERTDNALSTGDADLIALTLAPQFWAVSAVGTAAANYGGKVPELLNNVGLGDLVKKVLPGAGALGFGSDSEPSAKEKSEKPILDKISNLFLGAVAAKAFLDSTKSASQKQGVEQEEKKKSKNESRRLDEQDQGFDFEKDLERFMEDTGLNKQFEDDAKVLFEDMQKSVKEFDEKYESRKDLTEKLAAADNFEDFSKAVESLSDETEGLNSQEIKREMKKSVDKLKASEEFINQVKEESKKDDLTPDELNKAAEKVVFLDAKQNMEKEFGGFEKSFEKYVTEMGAFVKELLPTEEGMSILKKSRSPLANAVINFVESAKQKYFIV